MATVDKRLAEQIIAQNGYYSTDERVKQVIKYQNHWGGECYALLYEIDVAINRYQASDYVINPQVIWSAT
jgi:hypothetical protein